MSTEYQPLPSQDHNLQSSGIGQLSNYIRIYDHVLSESLCDDLIAHLKTSYKKYHHDSDFLRRDEVSLNKYEHTELFDRLQEKIKETYVRYKQDIGSTSVNLYQCNTLEFPVIVGYKPSEDKKEQFHDHADCWHFDSATRQISVIMYLSDVKEGGSTYFSHHDIRVNPVKGRILLFPANFMFMHRAEPPISDTKYASISWIHFDGQTKYISIKM